MSAAAQLAWAIVDIRPRAVATRRERGLKVCPSPNRRPDLAFLWVTDGAASRFLSAA